MTELTPDEWAFLIVSGGVMLFLAIGLLMTE